MKTFILFIAFSQGQGLNYPNMQVATGMHGNSGDRSFNLKTSKMIKHYLNTYTVEVNLVSKTATSRFSF